MDESVSGWELSKENIQPLRQGRKMDNLQTAAQLTADDKVREKELQAIRRQYEVEIRTYSGDDPLEVWYQYIKWVEQHFPKGGRDGHLFELIQKCLESVRDDDKYINDPRHLDIWLRCIKFIGEPLEIYQNLYSKNLFCELADFYIHWALQLEQVGLNTRADEVYNKGIEKIAQPIQNLNIFYKQFLARITKHPTDCEMTCEEDNRRALAELEQQRGRVQNVRRGIVKPVAQVQLPQHHNPAGGFQIFCDENSTSLLPPKAKESTVAPIAEDVRKENTQKPRKWSSSKISEKTEVVPIAGGHYSHQNFNIHTDPNAGQSNVSSQTICIGTNAVLSDKKVPSISIPTEQPNKPKYAERVMYCKDKIYRGTEEFSFEEIRAARWRKAEKERLKLQDKLLEAQKAMWNELQNKFLQQLMDQLTSRFADQSLTPSEKREVIKNSEVALKSFAEATGRNFETVVGDKLSMFVTANQPSTVDQHQVNIQTEGNSSSSPMVIAREPVKNKNEDKSHLQVFATAEQPVIDQKDHLSSASLQQQLLVTRAQSLLPANMKPPLPEDKGQSLSANMKPSLPEDEGQSLSADMKPSLAEDKDQSLAAHTKPPLAEDKGQSLAAHMKPPLTEDKGQSLSAAVQQPVVEDKFYLSMASPTVNTKAALGDVYRMFSKSFQFSSPEKLSESSDEKYFLLQSTVEPTAVQEIVFPIYHDSATTSVKSDELSPTEDLDSEDKENLHRPHHEEKRPLAGILQPSTNIHYVPLEEQEKMLNLEDQLNLDDIEPIPMMDRDDMTFIPPRNDAMFAALLACGSSTPFPTQAANSMEEKVENERLSFPLKDSQPETSNLKSKSRRSSAVHEDIYSTSSLSAITEASNESYSSSSKSSASCPSTGGRSIVSNHASEKSRSINSGRDKYLPSVSSLIEESYSKMDETQDIDPFCEHTINTFLLKYKDKILSRPGFIFKPTEKLPPIQKSSKLHLGNEEYMIEKLEGEGAYARIYRTRRLKCRGTAVSKIFKVQQPPCPWEYYITTELHDRLELAKFRTDITSAIVQFSPACIYSDGSILACEFIPYGTLLDMVNLYKKQNQSMPEVLIMYFTIELLHVLEQMHSCKIIHGDFKPDNIMIREGKLSLNVHSTDVEDMFPKEVVSLQVIDFGRSIDMSLFDDSTVFTTQVETDGFKCTEMKENKPWTYQIDLFGLAATVHCMLFNDYMKTEKKNGIWTICEHLKRYWHTEIWKKFFYTLLNVPSCQQQPNLGQLRKEFQAAFAERFKPHEFYSKHRQLCNFLRQ